MTKVLEQAMGLSAKEKLELISALWDSMAEHPESIPVPDWQLKELERRIEDQEKNPHTGYTWEAVNEGFSTARRKRDATSSFIKAAGEC
jgi:putative addiction module component (TIGR02574 family)